MRIPLGIEIKFARDSNGNGTIEKNEILKGGQVRALLPKARQQSGTVVLKGDELELFENSNPKVYVRQKRRWWSLFPAQWVSEHWGEMQSRGVGDQDAALKIKGNGKAYLVARKDTPS